MNPSGETEEAHTFGVSIDKRPKGMLGECDKLCFTQIHRYEPPLFQLWGGHS